MLAQGLHLRLKELGLHPGQLLDVLGLSDFLGKCRIRLAVDLGSPREHEFEWTSVNVRKKYVIGREGVQTEAVMASVTREQFRIRSELEIVHIPTGAVFSAYPYSNPDDMLESVRVIWGRADAPPDAQQVRRMASQLLLEQARASSVRRLSDAA